MWFKLYEISVNKLICTMSVGRQLINFPTDMAT